MQKELFFRVVFLKYMSVCYVFMRISSTMCLYCLLYEEPGLATVSGSQLHPAAAVRWSSVSPAETLLRLIQGEIMGPTTPNPLESHGKARQQAGREAQWSTGWRRVSKEQLLAH